MEFHTIMNMFANTDGEGDFPKIPPMNSVTEKPWMTHGRYHFSRTTRITGMGFKNMNRWWRYRNVTFQGNWDYAGYQMAKENWEEPEKKFNSTLTKLSDVLVQSTAGNGSDQFSLKTISDTITNLNSLAKVLDDHAHNPNGTGFYNAYQNIDVPDGPFRGSAAGVYANILYGYATRLKDLTDQTSSYHKTLAEGLSKLSESSRKLQNEIKHATSEPRNRVQEVMNSWYFGISAGTERWNDGRGQFEVQWRRGENGQGGTYGIPGDDLTDSFINTEIQNMWKEGYSGVLSAAEALFDVMKTGYQTTYTELTPIDDPISGSLNNETTNEDNDSGNSGDDWWKKYLESLGDGDGEGPPNTGDWDWDDIFDGLGGPNGGGNGGGDGEGPPEYNGPALPNNYPGLDDIGGGDGGPNGGSTPPPGYGAGVPDLDNTFPGVEGLTDSDWSVDDSGGLGGTGPLGLNGPGAAMPGSGSPTNGLDSPGGGFDPPLDTNFPAGGVIPPLGGLGSGGSTNGRGRQNGDPGAGTDFPAPSSLDLDPVSGLPINPDTGRPFPVDPDTGLPFNPDTGLPINYDPVTGQVSPIDPVTGLPISPGSGGTRLDLDPVSGLPINPDTGRPFPVDPDTGLPFNPDTGLPINYDPVTGQVSPIDPVTGLPVDSGAPAPPSSDPGLATNFPGAGNVPLNPITGEPADLDPLSGIPYPIDPVTGEPIRGGLDLGDFASPPPTRLESSDHPEGLNYPGAGGEPSTSSLDSGSGVPGASDRTSMFSAPGGSGAPGQAGGAGGPGGTSSPSLAGGQGSSGMPPMMPPMGGMGGGGGGDNGRERNRATWLSEDEKVWGTDKTRGKAVLGRPVPGEKKGTTRHEFIDAGADGSRTGTTSNDDAGNRGRKRKPGVGNRRGNGQEQARDGDGRRDRTSD